MGARNESSNSAGVNGDEDNNLAEDSGASYVFTRTGSSWSQQAYLKASNTGVGDEFGYSVDISGDTLVVGAVFESGNSTGVNGDQNDNSLVDSGAAYVFNRTGSTWNQQAYLKASNTGSDDRFGYAVAIFDDALIVGGRYEDSKSIGVNGDGSKNEESNSGAAYVFIRSDSSWSQHAYLKASTRGGDRFGHSVAISEDTLVAGASLEDNDLISASGGAYVFSVIPPHILPNNQWHQISLPMDPKTKNTVADIFADDGLGIYKTDWVIYS